MKKITVWRWLITGFFKKQKKIILLSTSIGVFFTIFIIWILPFIPRPNPNLKIGLIGQYRSNSLPDYITSKVGQGLTTVLEDGSVVPALANKWKIENNGKKYIFTIREDLYWQDNTPLKASDLTYEFTGVKRSVLDSHTLQFQLETAYTPFLNLVSKPILKSNIYGTGEYHIKKIKEKSGYVKKINLEGKNENIEITFYSNLDTAIEAFKLGEIDEIHNLYKNPFENDKRWDRSIIVKDNIDYNQYIGIFLHNKDVYTGDKTFRQALAYATPKVNDITRAKGPISVKSWAYNTDIKSYAYNKDKALKLMEKSLGSKEKIKNVGITLSTTQNFLPLADIIKKNWEETLGITVNIKVINSLNENFQALLISQTIPKDPDQYFLWHSTQPLNIINYNSIRIDKLLEDARQETDQDKRIEMYQDFQRFFVEDSPVIFLKYPQIYTIKRKNIVKSFITKLINLGKGNVITKENPNANKLSNNIK